MSFRERGDLGFFRVLPPTSERSDSDGCGWQMTAARADGRCRRKGIQGSSISRWKEGSLRDAGLMASDVVIGMELSCACLSFDI